MNWTSGKQVPAHLLGVDILDVSEQISLHLLEMYVIIPKAGRDAPSQMFKDRSVYLQIGKFIEKKTAFKDHEIKQSSFQQCSETQPENGTFKKDFP